MRQAKRNWTVSSIFDARGVDLRTPTGELVITNIDAWGRWYVITAGQTHETNDAAETAAVLNRLHAA